jgi:type VI secretion system secreted protein Hcp
MAGYSLHWCLLSRSINVIFIVEIPIYILMKASILIVSMALLIAIVAAEDGPILARVSNPSIISEALAAQQATNGPAETALQNQQMPLATAVAPALGSATTQTPGQTTMGPGGSPCGATNGAFLFLSDLPGESTSDLHEGWIEILAFNYSIEGSRGSAAGGSAAAATQRSAPGNLLLVKPIDKSSPQFYLMACNGKIIPEARLEIIHNGIMMMQYRLSDVGVSAVQVSGVATGNGQKPLEVIALSYGKIEWSYTPVDSSGNLGAEITTGWDLIQNMQA